MSRICQDIDEQVQAFVNRPLQQSAYAYVYLDATYLHGRLGKALQVCSRAVVVAIGVDAHGRRELLGLNVGDNETEGFWSEFTCCAEGKAYASLKERGLTGVRLVVSDAHVGLTNAIRRQLQGCVWQRCRAISLATCCSGSPGLTRSLSRRHCAWCSPRKTTPKS